MCPACGVSAALLYRRLCPHDVQVKPPRVAESAMHMECVLRHSYELKDPRSGKATGTIVIGEVLLMHVHDGVAGAGGVGRGWATGM